jgi:peroxiredoxin
VPNADGEDGVTEYRLNDAVQDGPVLVSFYVFDFHPECTEHMCSLHDMSWFDIDDSVTVFGVSTDRSFSHQEFATTEGLGFPLLSDSDGSVAEEYGVLFEEFNGHKRVSKRSVFVIDTDQTVRYAWSTDDPREQPDWQPVREALSTLGVSDS